jgi:hypothetical protein
LILAHGVGGRSDLPVPLWLALYAAALALVVSFVALGFLWTAPRLRGSAAGIELPSWATRCADSRFTRFALQAAGLLALGAVLGTAWIGPNDSAQNPATTWFYVWFWVGGVAAALALGPIYRLTNPLRTLGTLLHTVVGARTNPTVLDRIGYRPALVGLFAFLWLELVYPASDSPRAVAVFITIYAVVQIAAGARFGPRWYDRADGFEVYFSLVGRLSPIGRRDDGRIVVRNPLDGLLIGGSGDGLTAVVLLALGSTTFDGITRLPWWADLKRDLTRVAVLGLGTAGLVATIAAVSAAYAGAILLTGPYLRKGVEPYSTFVHSLIPIMVGYTVAHYFSLFVFQGQVGYVLVFGGKIDYTVVSTTTIAVVQIGAIVGGHILGVIAAHDRAVGVLRTGYLKVGQYAMLALMVAYTMVGIELVAGV